MDAANFDAAAGDVLDLGDEAAANQRLEGLRVDVDEQADSAQEGRLRSRPADISTNGGGQAWWRFGARSLRLNSRVVGRGRDAGNMDLPLGAQSLQPGDQQLADLLLGKQFANLARDFGEGDFGGAGLLQLGDKLVAIISLDGLGIDLDRGTKAGIHESHDVDLLADVGEKILFGEVVLDEKGLPAISSGRGLRILLAGIGDAGSDLGIGGVGEVGGLHLFVKKFLVDETVQNGAAIVIGKLGEAAVGEKSFVAEGFVPVALQNDAAVYGGDDAVDYLGGSARGWERSIASRRHKHSGR